MNIEIPVIKGDDRGRSVFFEYFHGKPKYVYSECREGTLKGFHYQTNPWCSKDVWLLEGTILDATINLRIESPNFGEVTWAEVSAPATIGIAEGFAHALLALDFVTLIYKFSPYWDYKSTVNLNLFEFSVPWEDYIPEEEFIISDRDSVGISLNTAIENGWVYT